MDVDTLEATMPERTLQRYAAFYVWRHEEQSKQNT